MPWFLSNALIGTFDDETRDKGCSFQQLATTTFKFHRKGVEAQRTEQVTAHAALDGVHGTHGPFDPIIPFDPVREQIQKLKSAGLKAEWREFPKAHTIHGGAEISRRRALARAFLSEAL